jgi:hypothetical protein
MALAMTLRAALPVQTNSTWPLGAASGVAEELAKT